MEAPFWPAPRELPILRGISRTIHADRRIGETLGSQEVRNHHEVDAEVVDQSVVAESKAKRQIGPGADHGKVLS